MTSAALLNPAVYPCKGAGIHIPASHQNEAHHVLPIDWQNDIWPEVTRAYPRVKETVSLCGTCHNNVHLLLNLLRRGLKIPVGYTRKTVAIARRGYALYLQNLDVKKEPQGGSL